MADPREMRERFAAYRRAWTDILSLEIARIWLRFNRAGLAESGRINSNNEQRSISISQDKFLNKTTEHTILT